MEHFINRVNLYKNWVNVGEPTVMWLSGIHIPESYLTALVQTTCRAKGKHLFKFFNIKNKFYNLIFVSY
jgi:hypothetical protein